MNRTRWRPRRPSWAGSVRSRFLYAVLAALLLPSVSFAAPGGDALVVADALVAPDLGLVFVMRPGGGIQALDLASGAMRWRSAEGTRPLALMGNRLVAQADPGGAGTLALVSLDARSGATRASNRVPIDEAVTASPVDDARASFRAWADASGSRLTVHWEHSSLSGTGVPQGYLPAAEEGQAPSLGGGQASFTTDATGLRLEGVDSMRAMTDGSTGPGMVEASVAGIRGDRQFLSADGRHVLVTERTASAEFRIDQHRWTIYDRESGAKLGSLRSVVSATPFVVVGRTLYYTSPPWADRRGDKMVRRGAMMHAVDLASGTDVWAKTVRDSAFRGPFPP